VAPDDLLERRQSSATPGSVSRWLPVGVSSYLTLRRCDRSVRELVDGLEGVSNRSMRSCLPWRSVTGNVIGRACSNHFLRSEIVLAVQEVSGRWRHHGPRHHRTLPIHYDVTQRVFDRLAIAFWSGNGVENLSICGSRRRSALSWTVSRTCMDQGDGARGFRRRLRPGVVRCLDTAINFYIVVYDLRAFLVLRSLSTGLSVARLSADDRPLVENSLASAPDSPPLRSSPPSELPPVSDFVPSSEAGSPSRFPL
jgi:hypothetical protein